MPKRLTTNEEIIFSKKDLQDVQIPHDNALVIHTTIAKFGVKRVLVDNTPPFP